MPTTGEEHDGEMVEQQLFKPASRWKRALPNADQRELGLQRIREIRTWMRRSET